MFLFPKVEDYITSLQNISDEKDTLIEHYTKQIHNLQEESIAVNNLIAHVPLNSHSDLVNTTTFNSVELLVVEFKRLKEDLDQLKIEKEILSETLSEHSSSFKKERRITSLLDEYDSNVSDALKNKEPVEKVQILMELTQQQMAELTVLRKSLDHLFNLFEIDRKDNLSIERLIQVVTEKQTLCKDIQKFWFLFNQNFQFWSSSVLSTSNAGVEIQDLKQSYDMLNICFLQNNEEIYENTNYLVENLKALEEYVINYVKVGQIIDSSSFLCESDLSTVEKVEYCSNFTHEQTLDLNEMRKNWLKLACSLRVQQASDIQTIDILGHAINLINKNDELEDESRQCKQYFCDNFIGVTENGDFDEKSFFELIQEFGANLKSILKELDDGEEEESEKENNNLSSLLKEHLESLPLKIEHLKTMEIVSREMSSLLSDQNHNKDQQFDGTSWLEALPLKLKKTKTELEISENNLGKQIDLLKEIDQEIETFEVPATIDAFETLSVLEQIRCIKLYLSQIQAQQKAANNSLQKLGIEEDLLVQSHLKSSKHLELECFVDQFTSIKDKLDEINFLFFSNDALKNNNDGEEDGCDPLHLLETIQEKLMENKMLRSDYQRMQMVFSQSDHSIDKCSTSLESIARDFIELEKKEISFETYMGLLKDSLENNGVDPEHLLGNSLTADGDKNDGCYSMVAGLLNQYQTIRKYLGNAVFGADESATLPSAEECVEVVENLLKESKLLTNILDKTYEILETEGSINATTLVQEFKTKLKSVSVVGNAEEIFNCAVECFTETKARNLFLLQEIDRIQKDSDIVRIERDRTQKEESSREHERYDELLGEAKEVRQRNGELVDENCILQHKVSGVSKSFVHFIPDTVYYFLL